MKPNFRTMAMAMLLPFLLVPVWSSGQPGAIMVNLSQLDGVDLTPDNLLAYQIQAPKATNVVVRGVLQYRNNPDLRIEYSFRSRLQPGVNVPEWKSVRPEFRYSSSALRDLFEVYKKLPQGIYEYCVSVQAGDHASEAPPGEVYSQCLYQKSDDLFLITLVEPEDEARIYEYYPMLSWIVNYPFASGLTYRIRVAELKDGQNAIAAVTRNNPVYQERNLMQTSMIYPVSARPLRKFQTYAWTVDAYYKEILLGGADPWRFTIVEDSIFTSNGIDVSHIDIARERGTHRFYVPGVIKLKYVLEDRRQDTLTLQLLDRKNKELKLNASRWNVVYGDNRLEVDLLEEKPLKHMQSYHLRIVSTEGKVFDVPFVYVNPDFIK